VRAKENETMSDNKIAMMPAETSDAEIAFGSCTIPPISDVPEPFRSDYYSNEWCKIAEGLFYAGGDVSEWVAIDGVDRDAAIAHFRSVLGSWEPKHEHKMAICGWMLSMWFTRESVLGGEK
jgi:hypothetical protein